MCMSEVQICTFFNLKSEYIVFCVVVVFGLSSGIKKMHIKVGSTNLKSSTNCAELFYSTQKTSNSRIVHGKPVPHNTPTLLSDQTQLKACMLRDACSKQWSTTRLKILFLSFEIQINCLARTQPILPSSHRKSSLLFFSIPLHLSLSSSNYVWCRVKQVTVGLLQDTFQHLSCNVISSWTKTEQKDELGWHI